VHYNRSRSFKVIETGTSEKPVYDFLLVINSNFGARYCDENSINRRFYPPPRQSHWRASLRLITWGSGDAMKFGTKITTDLGVTTPWQKLHASTFIMLTLLVKRYKNCWFCTL